MKLLEVRYHPTREAKSFFVVGHVVCHGWRAIVQVDESRALALCQPPVFSSLRYIAEMSGPRPFESLRALANPFWSFVEVSGDRSNDNGLAEASTGR